MQHAEEQDVKGVFEYGPEAVACRVDVSRCRPGGPDAQDAIWVAVVGPDRDSVSGHDAGLMAGQYVAQKYGANDGQDQQYGPVPDDGRVQAPIVSQYGADGSGMMTAQQYLQQASVQSVKESRGTTRYVCFYRIRRATAMW